MTTMPEAAATNTATRDEEAILEVTNLKMHFPVSSGSVSYTHLTLPTKA